MAKLPFPPELAGKVTSLLAKLPFLRKPATSAAAIHEPFEDLEDTSPDSDESFEPNALKKDHGRKDGARRLDPMALVRGLLGNPVLLGALGVALVFVLAAAVSSILAQAGPPVVKNPVKPITEEGRSIAKRLLLPPDPALDLSPPMEREPRLRYTDEDVRAMTPKHDPRDLDRLIEKNDAAIQAILDAVP